MPAREERSGHGGRVRPGPLEHRTNKVSPPSNGRGRKGPWELAGLAVREQTRRARRQELYELTDSARLLARDEGHRCIDCGSQGRWDPAAAAVVCQSCGQVLSRSRKPREAACGRLPIQGGLVRVRPAAVLPNGELRATVANVRRCGSAWRCPTCAKVQQARDAEVLHACNLGFRADHPGGDVFMATLTAPHRPGQRLGTMRRAIARAYKHVGGGAPVKRWREKYSVRATVRRLEVTHGPEGWHPHIHVMIFCSCRLDAQEQESLREWYFVHFGASIVRVGWQRPRKAGIVITKADREGRYLAKMGLLELAGDTAKFARCAACGEHVRSEWRDGRRRCRECGREVNRTPWQVLRDYHEHPTDRDRRIWREYYREIHGARRLTWSRWRGGLNLRAAYHVEQRELLLPSSCAELIVPWDTWAALSPAKRARVLDAYELGDRYGIESVLGDKMPPWREPEKYDPADPPLTTRDIEDRIARRLSWEDRRELQLARE